MSGDTATCSAGESLTPAQTREKPPTDRPVDMPLSGQVMSDADSSVQLQTPTEDLEVCSADLVWETPYEDLQAWMRRYHGSVVQDLQDDDFEDGLSNLWNVHPEQLLAGEVREAELRRYGTRELRQILRFLASTVSRHCDIKPPDRS